MRLKIREQIGRTYWGSLRAACPAVLLIALGTGGCVARQDVKTASKAVTQTIGAARGVEKDFNAALLAEIDRTRDQLARALIATAVYNQIEKIANDLESRGDLIGLSTALSDVNIRAQKFVALVEAAPPPANLDTANMTNWVRSLAGPAATSADPLGQLGISESDLRALLRLGQMREAAKRDALSQLDVHLAALAALHDQVDTWIQTDVTVKGDELAKVVEAIAARSASAPPVTP